MNERIAVLSCGGTIAMATGADEALRPELTGQQLKDSIPSLNNTGVEFEVFEVFNKDSTNVTPEDWGTLSNKIAEVQPNYHGVIVTHGTDTMAQTASATAFALGSKLPIPVVFTGSQLPLQALRTDAIQNVESAVQVTLAASREDINEAMVVFSHRVLRAVRTIKTSEIQFNAFDSPAFPHLADLTADDHIVFGPVAKRERSIKGLAMQPVSTFDRGVLEIPANTTTDPDIMMPSIMHEKCAAVILRSVGAGNVPDADAESPDKSGETVYSFLPLIEQSLEAGKPVILTSSFVGGRTRPDMYAPGKAALEAGAGHAGNMTDVAAKVKLMWLLGQGIRDPQNVRDAMLTPVVGEIDL
ncbi:MAG: asparaginase [Candidatus Saccharimonadales bacterium]